MQDKEMPYATHHLKVELLSLYSLCIPKKEHIHDLIIEGDSLINFNSSSNSQNLLWKFMKMGKNVLKILKERTGVPAPLSW